MTHPEAPPPVRPALVRCPSCGAPRWAAPGATHLPPDCSHCRPAAGGGNQTSAPGGRPAGPWPVMLGSVVGVGVAGLLVLLALVGLSRPGREKAHRPATAPVTAALVAPQPAAADPVPAAPTPAVEPRPDPVRPAEPAPARVPRRPLPVPVFPGAVPEPPRVDRDAVIERVKQSTALIEDRSEPAGTGFVIGPGLMMTNFHVIAQSLIEDLGVSFVSAADTAPTRWPAALLYADPGRDLAVLRVGADRPPPELADPGTELTGLEVAVVGNPLERNGSGAVTVNKVTTGRLVAPVRMNGWTMYGLQAEAFFGNSGGPVADLRTGKVVGVLTRIAGDGRTDSYCVPFGEVAAALGKLPADRGAESEVVRAALGRHAIAYIAGGKPPCRLAQVEDNAFVAMWVRLHLLKFKDKDVWTAPDGRTFRTSEVLAEFKAIHANNFALMQRMQGRLAGCPELSGRLGGLLAKRLEACQAMRWLAGATTQREESFRKEIEARQLASDRAARDFDQAYQTYLAELGWNPGPRKR